MIGDVRNAATSKGADEQSSRKAPGSLVDPGVLLFAASGGARHVIWRLFLMNRVDATKGMRDL